MRTLEELIKIKFNNAIAKEIEYEKLFAAKKNREQKNLPQGIWEEEEKPIEWLEIESLAWNFMQKYGANFKLYILWMEAYICVEGFQAIEVILPGFENFLKKHYKEFEKNYDADGRNSFIGYFDKNMYIALFDANINLDQKFINVSLKNANENINKIQDLTIQKLYQVHANVTAANDSLDQFLSLNNIVSTKKICVILQKLMEFLSIYQRKAQEMETQDLISTQMNQNDTSNFKNAVYYKEEAFNSIVDGLEILIKVDPQNIAIPLIKKAIKWQDLSLLEIFEDLGSSQEIEAFIKILKS